MVKDLRTIRISKGLTQEELAKLAGISRSTYVHIEHGKQPSLRSAMRIAKVLKHKVEEIFLPEVVNR
ncbi:MAG TPA: helix-turn-helix domain-containing protein [Bacillota bacterium]|nr:helix-turn-helix domain-containing protein [Bacillota bacterium]